MFLFRIWHLGFVIISCFASIASATTVQFGNFVQNVNTEVNDAGQVVNNDNSTAVAPVALTEHSDNLPNNGGSFADSSHTPQLLNQTVTQTHLEVDGSSSGIAFEDNPTTSSIASNSFMVGFHLDDAHSYTLDAILNALVNKNPAGPETGNATVEFMLTGNSSGVVYETLRHADGTAQNTQDTEQINLAATLPPGDYTLQVGSSGDGMSGFNLGLTNPVNYSATWEFDLLLEPLPNSVSFGNSGGEAVDARTGGGSGTPLGTQADFAGGSSGGLTWTAEGIFVDPDDIDSVISLQAEAALGVTRAADAGSLVQLLDMSLVGSDPLTGLTIGYSEALLNAANLPGAATVADLEPFLALWHWNDTLNQWEEIAVSIDTIANTITVTNPGALTFSFFAIAPSAALPVPEPSGILMLIVGAGCLIKPLHRFVGH